MNKHHTTKHKIETLKTVQRKSENMEFAETVFFAKNVEIVRNQIEVFKYRVENFCLHEKMKYMNINSKQLAKKMKTK